MPVTVPACARDHLRGPGKANNLNSLPSPTPKDTGCIFCFGLVFGSSSYLLPKKKKQTNKQAGNPKGTHQGLPEPEPLCVAATDQTDSVYASGSLWPRLTTQLLSVSIFTCRLKCRY